MKVWVGGRGSLAGVVLGPPLVLRSYGYGRRTEGQIDRRIERRIERWIDTRTDGQMDGSTDRRKDGRTDGKVACLPVCLGSLHASLFACLLVCVPACLPPSLPICLLAGLTLHLRGRSRQTDTGSCSILLCPLLTTPNSTTCRPSSLVSRLSRIFNYCSSCSHIISYHTRLSAR